MIKENRLRQIADNMKVSWNRFKMVTELTEGFEDRLSYGFDLIKYHGNWENLTEESWEYLFNAKEHPLKGWSVNSRHKIISYLDVKDITGEIPITEKSEKELREIIEKCKKENLQVLFAREYGEHPPKDREESRLARVYLHRDRRGLPDARKRRMMIEPLAAL